MLGLVLHGLMEYELSLKFLQNALTLTSKYHGDTSLKHAHRYVTHFPHAPSSCIKNIDSVTERLRDNCCDLPVHI